MFGKDEVRFGCFDAGFVQSQSVFVKTLYFFFQSTD